MSPRATKGAKSALNHYFQYSLQYSDVNAGRVFETPGLEGSEQKKQNTTIEKLTTIHFSSTYELV